MNDWLHDEVPSPHAATVRSSGRQQQLTTLVTQRGLQQFPPMHFRLVSEADIEAPPPDVRFTPESGHSPA